MSGMTRPDDSEPDPWKPIGGVAAELVRQAQRRIEERARKTREDKHDG